MLSKIKWWNKFSKKLTPPEVEYGAIRRFLGNLKGKLVLEVGCGTGHLIERYRKDDLFEGLRIVGTDLSPGMIEQALKRNPQTFFVLMSATDLPFRDEVFDKAYSWGVYHYLPWWKQKNAISEVHRVIKDRFVVHIFRMNRKWLRVWYRRYRYWRKNRGNPNYSTFAVLGYRVFRKFRKLFMGLEKDTLPISDHDPCILVAKK